MGFGNSGKWLQKVYCNIIPVGTILSLGGSFDSMPE
jgi:hypothetical protein